MKHLPFSVSDAEKRHLTHLPPELKRKIRSAMDQIARDPSVAKLLEGKLAGYRSYKISRFRIVYRVMTAAIELIAVGPREYVYQRALSEVIR